MIESHELVGAGDLFYVLYLGSYTKNAKMKTDEFRAFTLFPTKLPLLLLAKLHVFFGGGISLLTTSITLSHIDM